MMNNYKVKVFSLSDLKNLETITKKFGGSVESVEPVVWEAWVELPDYTNNSSISQAKWEYEPEIEDFG